MPLESSQYIHPIKYNASPLSIEAAEVLSAGTLLGRRQAFFGSHFEEKVVRGCHVTQ